MNSLLNIVDSNKQTGKLKLNALHEVNQQIRQITNKFYKQVLELKTNNWRNNKIFTPAMENNCQIVMNCNENEVILKHLIFKKLWDFLDIFH